MKIPYFPFYTQDWLSSTKVATLSFEEQGVYLHLLCRMWKFEDCCLPNDDAFIAKLLNVRVAKWKKLRVVLVDGPFAVFHLENGHLFNKRLSEEFQKVLEKSQKNSASAKKRWGNDTVKSLKNNKMPNANALPKKKSTQSHTDTDTDTEKKKAAPPDKPFKVDPDSLFAKEHSLYQNLIEQLGAKDNFNIVGKFGIFQSWIAYGCDYDLDIIGTAIAVNNRQKSQNQTISMAYLTPAVKSACDDRLKTGKSTSKPKVEGVSPDRWRERLHKFSGDQTWSSTWGPKPTEPGCYAPAEVLKQFEGERA